MTIGPIGRVSGEGWFQSDVEIKVNGFTGHISPYFELQDIAEFYDQLVALYERLNGVAELKPIEGQFGITVSGDGKGHLSVQGIAYTHAAYGSCLNFEFDLDQTHLPSLIRSIKQLMADYASNT